MLGLHLCLCCKKKKMVVYFMTHNCWPTSTEISKNVAATDDVTMQD